MQDLRLGSAIRQQEIAVKTFVASYECTTHLPVSDMSAIDAATEPYSLDARRCLDVSDDVRERGRMPEDVLDVVQAYATGENDDWDEGSLLTFVRISATVLAENGDDVEHVEVPDGLLRDVYRRMGLRTDIDAGFVLVDAEPLEDFVPRKPGDRESISERAASYGTRSHSI